MDYWRQKEISAKLREARKARRFVRRHEGSFCGVPISELTDEQVEEFYYWFGELTEPVLHGKAN